MSGEPPPGIVHVVVTVSVAGSRTLTDPSPSRDPRAVSWAVRPRFVT
jgi:hypothetical protein